MMNKNTKKIMTMVIAIAMVAALAACGSTNNGSTSSSVPATSPSSDTASSLPETSTSQPVVDEGGEYDATAQMYANAITGAREQDFNDAFGVFTHDAALNMNSFRNQYSDMKKEDGTAYTEDEILENHNSAREMQLSLLGLTEADVESYAISASPMNTKAYGIAIVKPAAGKEATVKAAMENFVTVQQKNFETYLADQYEIAKAGYVKALDDGTLVMVVSENQDTIYESISKAMTSGASTSSAIGTSSTSSK